MKAKASWEKKGERFRLSLEGVEPEFANVIRRYTMQRVDVPAIDEVVVYENSSSFFDEYIAHRMGLIPLKDSGKEEGELFLESYGPGTVYAKDLMGEDFEVAVGDIPIVTLLDGQRLRLKALVKRGKGRKHAKFQALIASYEVGDDGSIVLFAEDIGNGELLTYFRRGLEEIKADLERLKKAIK